MRKGVKGLKILKCFLYLFILISLKVTLIKLILNNENNIA
jgi:hypothetical protein